MSLLVSDAVNEIQQELNLIGQQVDDSDIFLYLTRAINYFSTTYAFPTARRVLDILLFPNVREYGLPDDFGTLIEPERPPMLHSPHFHHTTSRELTHWPYGKQTAIEYDADSAYLVANEDCGSSFLLSSCDSTDGVVLSGDGSGLSVDNMIYTQGTGSLRFTVTAVTGITTLTFTIPAFDISDFLTKDFAFLDLGCPSTNSVDLTGVKLRIGNDASNFYEMTATTRYRGQGIGQGFGLIGFNLPQKTTTGSVTNSNIVWMQVEIDMGLVGVNGVYHLDDIFLSQGVFYQIPYYTINNVLDQSNVPTEKVASTGDTILLPRQCDESILYKTLELIASSPNVANQSFANYAARELKAKEDFLSSIFPYQRSLVQTTWYKQWQFKRKEYGTSLGGW